MSAGSFKFQGKDSINPKDHESIRRLIENILGKFSGTSDLVDKISVEEVNERGVVFCRIIFPSETLHLSHESERAELCDLIADFCDAEKVNNVAVRLTFDGRPLEIFVSALSEYIEERFLDSYLFPPRDRGGEDSTFNVKERITEADCLDALARGGDDGEEAEDTPLSHVRGSDELQHDQEVNSTLSVTGAVVDDDPARNHLHMGGVANSFDF